MAMGSDTGQERIRQAYSDEFLGAENPVGFCVVTLLAWIAACDGSISEEEEEALRQIAAAGDHGADIDRVLRYARLGQVAGLQLACEVLLHALDPKRRLLFMQMALGVALADGYLKNTEIHILFLLADLLNIGPSRLNSLFKEMTGHPMPGPGDVSSVRWWEEREQPRSDRARGKDQRGSHVESHSQSKTWALATLGLEPGATGRDIHKAYLRLARIHHPDRFRTLGKEALKASTLTFQRIHRAYEILGSP